MRFVRQVKSGPCDSRVVCTATRAESHGRALGLVMSRVPIPHVRWGSAMLVTVAVLTTLVAAVFGTLYVWGLYADNYGRTAIAVPSADVQQGEPLLVGVARSPGGPCEWITFAKVLARVQRDLGRPLVVRYSLSSDEQIALIERDRLDIALMSTLAYLDVQQDGLVELIATPVVSDRSSDAAVVVVRTGDSARSIRDLQGSTYAVSEDLAGVAYSYWLLRRLGYDPDGFFSKTPVDGQQSNLAKVASGKARGTSVRLSALASWSTGTFKILEQSPALGMPPIVARRTLDASTVARVRHVLLTAVGDGVIPQTSAITGFRQSSDEDYDFARELDATNRGAERRAFGGAHQ